MTRPYNCRHPNSPVRLYYLQGWHHWKKTAHLQQCCACHVHIVTSSEKFRSKLLASGFCLALCRCDMWRAQSLQRWPTNESGAPTQQGRPVRPYCVCLCHIRDRRRITKDYQFHCFNDFVKLVQCLFKLCLSGATTPRSTWCRLSLPQCDPSDWTWPPLNLTWTSGILVISHNLWSLNTTFHDVKFPVTQSMSRMRCQWTLCQLAWGYVDHRESVLPLNTLLISSTHAWQQISSWSGASLTLSSPSPHYYTLISFLSTFSRLRPQLQIFLPLRHIYQLTCSYWPHLVLHEHMYTLFKSMFISLLSFYNVLWTYSIMFYGLYNVLWTSLGVWK